MKQKDYYLGLDIGTDSVGYAVTNEKYDLLKLHGDDAWGVQVFDAASLSEERRSFRSARRRLDRRQQRVLLLQELFAKEIAKIDPKFFVHIKESALYGEQCTDIEGVGLFRDTEFSDATYFHKYPTIHHLICELMTSDEPHDVRLVYLACAWLVAHRGHFLSNIDVKNIDAVKDFNAVYDNFREFFIDNGYEACWGDVDKEQLSQVIKAKKGISYKQKDLSELLFHGVKPSKEITDEFPFSREGIIKLLAGGTYKLKDLFGKEEYDEFGSITLGMDEDKYAELSGNIGEDYEVISLLRAINDWAVLVDVIGDNECISQAKVAVYDQHKKDLAFLKYVVKKYLGKDKYDEVFRALGKDNYVAYSYHTNDGNTSEVKKKGKEEFSKYISGIIKDVVPDEKDAVQFSNMTERLGLRTFMPKQKDTDNRVIPHQMYQAELIKVLDKAEQYLPFLKEIDEDKMSVSDKIKSIFTFRIPYFVGPLNTASKNAWVVRKEGKIYPWNFDRMVDLDASEQEFIQRMTNSCTYLPGESVLPQDSLCYHKFMVLDEINNITINGQRISVELKQRLYNELFMNLKKVTRKRVTDWLISNGELDKNHLDSMTGIDIEIKSNLAPQIAYKRLINAGTLTEDDVERIIERSSYAEDKNRLKKWIGENFPQITDEDKKYISGIKAKDFGRLSRKFLSELEGASKETGEMMTILGALWNTQCNLMELLSDKFTFSESIKTYRENYYGGRNVPLEQRLDEMYISNAVRRPIYRTLDIVNDIKKAFGVPKKIFIEMTRGGSEDQKGVRTKSRKQQLIELYEQCKDLDVKIVQKQLEDLGEAADNRLQGDKLFLYFMQLGKCMYTGKSIDLSKLADSTYNIDHIYPQAFVKDDSILNNKVLVYSEVNGEKKDVYPIDSSIRNQMGGLWDAYHKKGLITDEKYHRLTRSTPFTENEKYEFINRQLVETSQSTKAIATLLQEKFGQDTEIVYCKARLASEFRQEFGIWKSRLYNDLHHAVDAYLNIVTGNVYNMKFTKKWFNVNQNYSIKTTTIFTKPQVCGGQTIWDGENMLAKVKKVAVKNTAHFNKYAYFKHGGLFDQMPVSKGDGLTPLKKNLPTERYGGYNKSGAMFYIPVRYKVGKKTEVIIMSVELMYGKRFLSDYEFAVQYSFDRLEHILNKRVDEVSFPMGMRPWKVNTVLSLDGFRVVISGIAGGGKCLIAQPSMQFKSEPYWQYYLKKVEEFVKKIRKNEKYLYDEKYDAVSIKENITLYQVYQDKIAKTLYQKRINSPASIILSGKTVFETLDIKQQCMALLNIQQVFGRISNGCDLSAIGGTARSAATVGFSATISNWKKNYSDVRLIDISASGLWEKKSQNLLDLL